ncbi:xanthine dehydrogenase family protein subunit M [Dehalococcoidia bacterium]|nr:xanthine dehydrogenase family protein subunit M [Dehalococcoidia bacterium]
MIPASFQYHKPGSVAEAADLLSKHGSNAKILAGGHSLIPMMKLRLAQPEILIDLGAIGTMSYIENRDGGQAIGGMTTYAEIASSGMVPQALSEAAGQVADVQVRNRGTIGGSLAHNDPAADLPAVVVALDGQIITSSTNEHRSVLATDFFQDLFTTDLTESEIISEIFIPGQAQGSGSAYLKFANKASHFAIVGVAASVTLSEGRCVAASIGITGAGPTAYKAKLVEENLVGTNLDHNAVNSASEKSSDGIDMNDDIHASADYRAHLAKVFTARAVRLAADRAD